MYRRFEVNGSVYQFNAWSWETRNSWGHECELYKDGVKVTTSRARYYNRTWEAYQYQSVMLGCVYNLVQQLMEKKKPEYLQMNGWKRLRSKEDFEEWFNKTPERMELQAVSDFLHR